MKVPLIAFGILSELQLLLVGSMQAPAQQPDADTTLQPRIAFEPIEWIDYRVYGADKNDLPRVLLIGDSISGQYFEGVVKALKGKAYVTRLGSSKAICLPVYFDEIKLALSQYKYSVIHFNNGLHGWAYSEEEYGQNLAKLVDLLKNSDPAAKLIWASSTPLRSGPPLYDGFQANNDRVKARNKIAADMMAQQGIPIDDLYKLMEPHHDLLKDGTHYKPEGEALLIPQVTQSIQKTLETK